MFSTAESKIQLAYQLIEEDRLNEARATLLGVDHPDARVLEQYISDVYPEKAKRSIPVAPQPYAYAQPYNQPMIVVNDQNPHILTQILWFLFIGSWASQVAIVAAFTMIATIVLMPFGIMLLNRISYIMALRSPKQELVVKEFQGALALQEKQQLPFLVRSIYFLLVGWWATLVLIELAWAFALTIIGLPVAFMILNWIPEVLTLRQQ